MKQVGVTCDVVADGDEVLPKARDVRSDASLLDIVMERLEGVDSCRRVRESGVEAAMIAVTANGDTPPAEDGTGGVVCVGHVDVRQRGRGEGVEGGCRGLQGTLPVVGGALGSCVWAGRVCCLRGAP